MKVMFMIKNAIWWHSGGDFFQVAGIFKLISINRIEPLT
jgi:hypothetical protein